MYVPMNHLNHTSETLQNSFCSEESRVHSECLPDPDLATLPESLIVMICLFHKHFIALWKTSPINPNSLVTTIADRNAMLPKNSSRPFETLHQLEVIHVHCFDHLILLKPPFLRPNIPLLPHLVDFGHCTLVKQKIFWR